MNDIEAVVALPEMDGGSAELKNQVYEMTDTKANPAKTQPVAGAPPPTEIPAGCALVAADTGSVVSEVSPKVEAEVKAAEAEAAEAEAAAEVEALEAALATAKAKAKAAAGPLFNKAAEDKAAKVKASGKASNLASIIAASMLAQICERNFMEHQLAACHFKFFHFCEHARVLCVCVRVPIVPPRPP